jgi:starch synthase (maltosyl-transferring)
MDHGVRIFRVDNPHTKPLRFWERLLGEIRGTDPDVLFLAEAFTRPAMMHTLAKIGFHQSYTYFTWRNGAQELEEYMLELSGDAAVLAAMLSPTWGIYSGYELCENVPIRPGSEEYMDSEKYQYRPRDWEAAARDGIGIADYITELNRIRRTHPALHRLRNLRFHAVDQPGLMCFSKHVDTVPGGSRDDTVLVVVNLDPYQTREATVWLDLPALGVDREFIVTDELTGESYRWGHANYVRLNPATRPAHVFSVTPPQ